jgi:hypothetical protein
MPLGGLEPGQSAAWIAPVRLAGVIMPEVLLVNACAIWVEVSFVFT